jgi:hypothetical protein
MWRPSVFALGKGPKIGFPDAMLRSVSRLFIFDVEGNDCTSVPVEKTGGLGLLLSGRENRGRVELTLEFAAKSG